MAHKNQPFNNVTASDLFYLTVNILNLEEKLKYKLATVHPFNMRKLEMVNELSNRGLNVGDFIDIDNQAKEYIQKHK